MAVDALPRVRDLHGHVVWRVKVATPEEMTCRDCGEIAVRSRDAKGNAVTYCFRCAAEDEEHYTGGAHNLVPTLSYLREGEWEQ